MHISQTSSEMRAIVESLRLHLESNRDLKRIEKQSERARQEVWQVHKAFKRKIDERARYKAGDKWFPIHAREGIEQKLAEVTAESLAAIEALGNERK